MKDEHINDEIDDNFLNELDLEDEEQINNEIDKIEKDSLAAKKIKAKDKVYYVNNKELAKEIKKYQDSKKNDPNGKGHISEELGEMIMKVCIRFSLHSRFYGYTYRDEMVADAIYTCLYRAIDKIDLSLPNCNPFSYITQVAFNCFRGRINTEKKFMETKKRFREYNYSEFEQNEGLQQTQDNPEEDN